MSLLQGHSAAGRIRSIEKIHLIGTRTRDLPACSIVPQPAKLPRAPGYSGEHGNGHSGSGTDEFLDKLTIVQLIKKESAPWD
jgi:hypothetical protein